MKIAENPLMAVLPNKLCARNLFESEVISSPLGNSESWIKLNDTRIKTLQDFQNAS